MSAILGAVVAALLGGADFLGGFTSRRSSSGSVVVASQLAALVTALVIVSVLGDPLAPDRDLLLGFAAGAAGVIGLACLYRGLAAGRMSVVAPVSAVGSAAIPMVWGIVRGERPAPLALVGAGVAVIAIVLVARPATDDSTAHATIRAGPELALAAGAAFGFGLATALFSETGAHAGAWPALSARGAMVPLAVAAVMVRRGPLLPHRRDLPFAFGGGILDACSNVVLLVAFREGLTSEVAPVVALYPAVTVLLARVVLREHVGRLRLLGLVLAFSGLALVASR